MKLVDDAKRWWTWLSMQAMIIAGAIQASWLFVPDDMKVSIPANVVQVATLVLLGLGVMGRVVKQKP